MSESVYDLRKFYSKRAGRLVRRLISSHIAVLWDDVKGDDILGYGYAVPYLRTLQEKNNNCFAVMPSRSGVHLWPNENLNKVCLSHEGELPFATESIDKILVVHGFEYSEDPLILSQELWRVLKSNGRLMLVVPNRLGLWARGDWTPFGHGRPYSHRQIHRYLQDNLFVVEREERALYMPPFRSFLVLRTAYTMEVFGKYIFPGLAGVHLIEASKQIYAGIPGGKGQRIKGRKLVITKPAPT
jgi:SAM-dependent methyltransferase